VGNDLGSVSTIAPKAVNDMLFLYAERRSIYDNPVRTPLQHQCWWGSHAQLRVLDYADERSF
jgi:hypothetical protein